VGKNPDAVSLVASSCGTSRNNKRPRGVAVVLQISEHSVERHRDDPSNVFANDPTGSRECNNLAHLRPEIAVVVLRGSLACDAERLAGKATTDEVDPSEPTQSICVNCADVLEAGDAWPVFSEDGAAKLVSLAERDSSHSCSLKSERETTDAAEEVEDIHVLRARRRCSASSIAASCWYFARRKLASA
jgi:hypothetical protein